MKKLNILCAFVIMLVMSSCTIAKISGSGAKPMLLNNPARQTEVIESFEESKMVVFDYSDSYDISKVTKEVLKKYPNADALTNIKIKLKRSVATGFINLFTIGFANAYVIEIEGDAIKFTSKMSMLGEPAADDTVTLRELQQNEEIKVDGLMY